MTNTEARKITFNECKVKCVACEEDCENMLIGECRKRLEALEQEPVLDKIRAEIEALIEWHDCPIEYDDGNDAWYCEACNQALKIIDKYKAESEKE